MFASIDQKLIFISFFLLPGVLTVVRPVTGDSDFKMCDRGILDIWTNDFGPNERMFFATTNMCADTAKCEDPNIAKIGSKVQARCLAKGPEGKGSSEILDPYLRHDSVQFVYEFYSASTCSAGPEIFGLPAIENVAPSSSANAKSSGDTCQRRESGAPACSYPCQDGLTGKCAGLTAHPERPEHSSNQNHWLGPVLKINSVNGESLDSAEDKELETSLIHGIGGKACIVKKGNEIDQTDYIVYDGGLLITRARGTFAKSRTFMFKNEEVKVKAKLDPKNAGLKYAKSFVGASGCDAEIIMEFTPAPGGGIELSFGATLTAFNIEDETLLLDEQYVHVDGNEVVVSLKKSAMVSAQHVEPCEAEDSGYLELFRFENSFICKNTGDRINASVVMRNAGDKEIPYSNFSTDPSSPTPYQTNPKTARGTMIDGVMVPYYVMELILRATADEAPESCGTLYWDPLVHANPGDGRSSNVQGLGLIIAGAVVAFLGLVIGICVCIKCKRKKQVDTKTAQAKSLELA